MVGNSPLANKHRIQTILLTFPIAGIIGLFGTLLRGPFALPIPDVESWAQAASQPVFVIAQVIILIGYIMPLVGFWALYKYLEVQGYEKISFGGFILSILGTALALPALGIAGFAGPVAAELYLTGNTDAASLISSAVTGIGFIVSISAAICYIIGPVLLGIAIWKSDKLPKWIGLLFALHGLFLSLGFSMYPILILGWVLITASSVGFIIIIYRIN